MVIRNFKLNLELRRLINGYSIIYISGGGQQFSIYGFLHNFSFLYSNNKHSRTFLERIKFKGNLEWMLVNLTN